jgi:large subunit ribosomal protein L9
MSQVNIILLERVAKLGQIGDVVTVKAGFARNFLLPQKKALRATEANKLVFEAQRAQIETSNQTRKTDAQATAQTIEGTTVVLIRQAGDSGQLYGSVSTRDIADELVAAGFKVNKNQVVLDKPIKNLGIHGARVALHPEVIVAVRANVARSKEESELQAKGVDVLRMQAEEEANEAKAAAAEAAEARAELMADAEQVEA